MLLGNLTEYPYPSMRPVIMGKRGAVATSQPQAAIAGMEMLLAGGNAVDAAIAMAITLTVVKPTANGIGSDAFALVWDGKVHGLNGSGKSPQNLTIEKFAGQETIPNYGWLPVTVPGAVSAWRMLWERWGKLPFEQLFAPAIRYATEGFPVSPETAQAWKAAERIYLTKTGTEFTAFKEIFFPKNRAPAAGEMWGSLLHAQTLTEIANTGGESFYQGNLATKISQFAAETGGLLTGDDLSKHQADWVSPIATDYRQVTVWELPPNTPGIATLIALNILEGFNLDKYPRESVDAYHLQIESIKLAFADLHRYNADPRYMKMSVHRLLDKDYADERRRLIGHQAIAHTLPGLPKGGTVYLATADRDLMVSFIQSNYMGFGCGIVVPETGISLHNRGCGFTLETGHPNQVGPGKRPLHTIMPGFLTENSQPLGPFGVMGGPMQPQGHLQMVTNLVDYQLNPQAALDAPRWRFLENNQVILENSVSEAIIKGLLDRGHAVQVSPEKSLFGRGQMILQQNDVFVAASEPRSDGMAIAF